MKYKVTLDQTRTEICHWVLQLNDPLMLVRMNWNSQCTDAYFCIIASGPSETVLLLKYGNILEQVL